MQLDGGALRGVLRDCQHPGSCPLHRDRAIELFFLLAGKNARPRSAKATQNENPAFLPQNAPLTALPL
jgi:hypothetical protein